MFKKLRYLFQPFLVIRGVKRFFNVLYYKVLFKINGIVYGKNLQVFNHFYLMKHIDGECIIGDNFRFISGDNFNPLSRNIGGSIYIGKNGAKLTIGNNVGISASCIWCSKSITIGNDVKIGSGCIIMDTDSHSLNYLDRKNDDDFVNTNRKPVVIGDDVLIGTRSIVLKGVSIGERSVIGAGSIVTSDIPSNCIAAGNPCRVIKLIEK